MKSTFTKMLYISLLTSLSFLSTQAQNSTIGGTITDLDTGDPLIGATIKSGDKGVVTDLDGNYSLSLPAGNHKLNISFIGYETISKSIKIISGEAKRLDIQMTEQASLLQTATITSGKYEKPLGEVTVSLEVIKPRLAESINSTSVSNVLDKVPGVTIIGGQASIRGGSGWSYGAGSRVLLLVDDIPAFQADAGRPNWGDLPIENIAQIEVVKGAASALYGSSAMNGIINLRTGYAKSKPETKIATFGTIYGDPKDKEKIWWDDQPFETGLSFSHKQKVNKLDLVFSGYGFFRNDYKERNTSRDVRLTTSLRYRIKENLSVGVNANFNRNQGTSYFYWKDWGADALRGNETSFSESQPTRIYIDPFVNYFDNNGNRHKFLSRMYFIDNNNDGNQSNQSQLYYGEYQYQKRMDDKNLVITTGLVGIHTGIQAAIYGDTSYTTSNLAGYFQADKKLFEKLNLSFGARYERNAINSPSEVNGIEIPDGKAVEAKPVFRIGANYQVGLATYLRASWGQGYRFPTIAEKFVETNAGAIRVYPNAALSSETGWTTELAIKQGMKFGEWSGYFDIAAFWSEYTDMMEFSFVPEFFGFQSQNIGNTVIKGIDISLAGEGKINDLTLYVIGGYTYTDPKFKEYDVTGKDIPNAANRNQAQANAWNSSANFNILKYRNKHSFKMDVEGIYKGFSVGLAANYLSHMEAIDFIFEQTISGLLASRMEDTNGSIVFNGRMAYRFNEHLKTSFLVKNLFNEEYVLRPGILQPPTNYTLRVDYNF